MSKESNQRISKDQLNLELDGHSFLVVHDLKKARETQLEKAQVILFAHTHKPQVSKKHHQWWINPGECGGWLTGRPTIALLNTHPWKVEIIDLPR